MFAMWKLITRLVHFFLDVELACLCCLLLDYLNPETLWCLVFMTCMVLCNMMWVCGSMVKYLLCMQYLASSVQRVQGLEMAKTSASYPGEPLPVTGDSADPGNSMVWFSRRLFHTFPNVLLCHGLWASHWTTWTQKHWTGYSNQGKQSCCSSDLFLSHRPNSVTQHKSSSWHAKTSGNSRWSLDLLHEVALNWPLFYQGGVA